MLQIMKQATILVTILIADIALNAFSLQNDHCGERLVRVRGLIVGGKISQRGMWPWQVGIYKKQVSGWKFWCGGALVSRQWVLTAAHCFYVEKNTTNRVWFEQDIKQLAKYKIKVGDHELRSYESSEQEHQFQEIFVHPDYRHDPIFENDIALVKLNREVILGPYVRTVCLPAPDLDLAKPGTAGIVAGWGITESGYGSSFLRYSVFNIQTNSVCRRAITFYYNKTVAFCASDVKGHSAPCYGDSGGSMVRKLFLNGKYRFVTIGLVSWGGCTLGSYYGFYTRLQPFLPWIYHKVNSTCIGPGQLTNGVVNSTKSIYQPNEAIRFTCNINYMRIGKSELTCQRNGTWNGNKPKCVITCSKPKSPPNAKVRKWLKERYLFNEIVIYDCEYGHFTTGYRVRRCTVGGKWSELKLRCIPKSCGDPGTPKNGRRNGYLFTFKKKVHYECDSGHILIGPQFRVCQSNQKWSDNTPTCELIECQDPGKPNFGGRNPDLDKYVYESKIEFSCKTNHTLKGDKHIICQHDKTWTGTKPTCLRPCPDPGIPRGGYRLHHSFLHAEKVSFKCMKGWLMVGEKNIVIECNNGNWDKKAPECLMCNFPLGMQNRKIRDKNIRASSSWSDDYDAKYGRLHGPRAWCSGPSNKSPYLEVDLEKPYRITYIATQGNPRDNQWEKKYRISHALKKSYYIEYRENDNEKVFIGNSDSTTVVKHKLKNPFTARMVRFRPIWWKFSGYLFKLSACMRVEIYGCNLPTDCVMVGSRVLGNWDSNYHGGDVYYKSFVKNIDDIRDEVQLEIEDDNHNDDRFKTISKTHVVLDVPNKQLNLPPGTRVLPPLNNKHYTGTIESNTGSYYGVRFDDNTQAWILKREIRVLKPTQFCGG